MDTAADVVVEKTTRGRNALNFWVDLVTAVAFMILLGTSTLMKFILPPGTCDADGVKIWLGHSRHWWGDIHFWVAMLMLVLMVVHVWLHWGWVVRTWGKLVGSGKAFQTWALLGGMVAVLAVPFVIPAKYLVEMPNPDHYTAAGEEAPVEVVQASVAPCGVEGLSCADCPAASDRLFGGSCSGSEPAAEEEDAACESGSECSTCDFAAQCASGEEAAAEEDEAAKEDEAETTEEPAEEGIQG